MQSQNTLASLVAGVCTTHRSTESHSWLCRYCLGLLSYLQINCGYLSPGLLHSKVVKGVSISWVFEGDYDLGSWSLELGKELLRFKEEHSTLLSLGHSVAVSACRIC